MKKTVILIMVLLVLFSVSSLAIVGLATGILDKKDENDYVYQDASKEEDKYIQYVVETGTMEISEIIDGYIGYRDNAIVYVEAEKASEYEIYGKISDMVRKDDVLGLNGSKELKAPVDGKIVDIRIGEKVILIGVVDYAQSYIKVSIPEKYQNRITSSTVITGNFQGNTEQLSIKGIVPAVSEGGYELDLNNPFDLYENTKVAVTVNFDVKERATILAKEAVRFNAEGKAYVNVLQEDGSTRKTYITLGEQNLTSYEITDGEELIGKTVVVNKEELMLDEDKNE